MALVNHNINSLNGGVSRQPNESRFDNQVEEMVNFIPDVSGSIFRRNPLMYVKSFPTAVFNDRTKIHSYNRGDGLEKYGMLINDNGLSVADADGNLKTVNIVGTNPITYWKSILGSTPDWKKHIKFLTVGDTTWVLNTGITVAMTSDTTTSYSTDKAFYWINRSFDNGQGAGYTYSVTVGGETITAGGTSTISSMNTLINGYDTEDGVDDLTGVTCKVVGSIARIAKSGLDSDTTFATGDSWGNQASISWRTKIDKIQDLPSDMSGFAESEVGIIEVTGTDKDSFTSYYLKWNGENWTESVKSGILNTFDASTLPAKIVRQSDGTFSFGFNVINGSHQGFDTAWGQRKKGDDDSNPIPSFVGRQISNMFFFKNRLGFTSEENVILSETGEYYNFWATTAMDIIDSDPIDASVDSDTVSILRSVNATAGSLTLWADDGQFVLSGGDILSPATTRISKTSSYNCSNVLSPVLVDNEIIFFSVIGSEFNALSYSPASLNTDTSTASSITSHIKGYLPSTISDVVVSSASNMVFFTDSANKDTIYVYRYYVSGGQKSMSSWFKWVFDVEINTIEVLDNELFVLCNGTDISKIELDYLDLDDNFYDFNSTTKEQTELFESKVTMSVFNIQTKQETRIIRENFYTKSIAVSKEGSVDMEIKNKERNRTNTISNKNMSRKIFIGGNTNKIELSFVSSYNTGCKINAISLEGVSVERSRNY